MSFTKINAAGIGSTEAITVDGLTVVNDGSFGGSGTFGGDGSFGGNVSIAGTLTYEDVTNIDSVGLITARNGIVVGSGITLSSDGNAFHTGIVTATSVTGVGTVTSVTASGIDLSGLLREGVKITAGKLSNNTNIDLENGMVHYFTTQETTTSTPNIRFSSSVTLNDVMQIGETISVTIITTAAAGGYSAQLNIDGGAVTENWVGGDAPSDGGSSGVDIYAYTIIKTANATFTVIGNQSKTS